MQSPLNVDQLVMARDRHRLNRLQKGKDANQKQYQELFEKSHDDTDKATPDRDGRLESSASSPTFAYSSVSDTRIFFFFL